MTDVNLAGPESASFLPGLTTGELGLRLKTLVRLRWLAVAGQTAAVVLVYWVLGFDLPVGWCLAAIALSAWLNIFLTLRWRGNLLTDRNAALLLGYDILQLALLLYLTGGLRESLRLLVPRAGDRLGHVAADQMDLGSLRHRLYLRERPRLRSLPACRGSPQTPLELPAIYVVGMWTALVSGVVFSAIYARRIAEEARQMSAALVRHRTGAGARAASLGARRPCRCGSA